MAINASDIKLLESEVMADTTDGGGRRTSRVIPDGVAGNIFPKVSRLDSVYGRVNLRKVYAAVQTANVDTYAGSHVIVTDAPDNEKIHTTLFSTASEYDSRTIARDRIESYVTSGPESRMILLGRQLAGQQTFTAYQRVEEPLPEVGTVLALTNEPGNVLTTFQYIRIQDIAHEVRNFEDSTGVFQRRVVTVDTGVPLRYEFNGPETASRFSGVARSSKVRDTTVVDAARYFGIQPLAVASDENDLDIQVASVYTPIVPTTNRETPIANEGINEALNLIAARASTVTENFTGFSAGVARYTLRAIQPGTLNLGGFTDDGLGNVAGATLTAAIDYESGVITRTGGSAGSSVAATYVPAASAAQPAHTRAVEITLGNRGSVYVLTLNPLPSPGTVIVDYRALGKWYRLRDLGDGTLAGADPAYGVGTIDYASGSLVVTLGALPDVGSSVLMSWGTPAHFSIRSGASSNAAAAMKQSFTLPSLPVVPDSVAVTYTSGSVEYTATDNASGVLTGDGITGTVNYTTGTVDLQYTTRLPDAASNVAVAYQYMVPDDVEEPLYRSTTLASAGSMNVGDVIVAGSLTASIPFAVEWLSFDFAGNLVVRDNGAGLMVCRGGQPIPSANEYVKGRAVVTGDAVVGTINYATGEVVINASAPVTINIYQHTPGGGGSWSVDTSKTAARSGGTANFGWKSDGPTGTPTADTYEATFSAAPIKLDLTSTIGDNIVPGSIMFAAGGKTFIDRNGTLYADVSATTGAGIAAGTVNYDTGEVSLSYWTDGASLGISVSACLSQYGAHDEFAFSFRTPGSPIRPGSFYVQATTTDGTLLSGTSDDGGDILGTKVTGSVNQELGVVTVKFGEMVTAAGNEAEWWYDADEIVGGQIFKPSLVMPSSLTFNCVVLANLPLNADILGLDPVRLPSDGRVPIYRPADVVVIHHTQATELTNPVVAGNTYSVGRTFLAELWLEDQNGVKLTADQYETDPDTGEVTIDPDFVAGALVQPLVAKHRIEDMNLVTDVQINGQLTLAAPLSRDFPLGTLVSSALLFGDMNSRVTNVFDLLSFSTWSDTPGTQATAQYNNIDYPIEVLNNGAVTERWRISFTSTTAFQVIGENLGVIATGSTGADCAPVNALTLNPYFTIRADGWGAGWSAGNQLRFNTISAAAPIWIARTVLPGATLEGDSFSIQARGDVDAD